MAATIKDIARASGLSVATVSKFINGRNVREKNRIVLEQAIREQNYRINESARALKTNRSRTIGLVVAKFGDVFASELASAIVKELRKHQYSLLVCESHNSLEGEEEAFDFLTSKQVDGIMTTLIGGDCQHYQDFFEKYSIPVVLFDSKLERDYCDTVILDNVQAAYTATRHLIDAGHRDIAIIRGSEGFFTADQRFEGYKNAMRDAGIPIQKQYVVTVDYAQTDMYDCIKDLFSQKKHPTAVFSVNHFTTMSTIMALNELDISIPGEVSVFGFDNYYLSNLIKPRLWLMEQPLAQIAEEGTKMMMKRITQQESNEPFHTVEVPAIMVPGDSVKKI